MSLNISKAILNVSDVKVTVDVNKLAKVQRTRLAKFLTAGIVVGNGVPARIARALRDMYKAPTFTAYRKSNMSAWSHLDPELDTEAWKALTAACVTNKMFQNNTGYRKQSWVSYHEKVELDIKAKMPSSSKLWYLVDDSTKSLFNLTMRNVPEIEAIIDGLKSGELTHIEINGKGL